MYRRGLFLFSQQKVIMHSRPSLGTWPETIFDQRSLFEIFTQKAVSLRISMQDQFVVKGCVFIFIVKLPKSFRWILCQCGSPAISGSLADY